ncbi:MAG: hypothetical protein HY791_30655 [Deltaproteobacteria bacterium]|nr:hypothetical protein [Deltaproteobacteria bacterium]
MSRFSRSLLGLPAALSCLTACGARATSARIDDEVFRVSCTFSSCHQPPSSRGDLDLTSPAYDRIVGVASTERPEKVRVAPGSPDQSYLLDKLLGRDLPAGPADEPWTSMPPESPLDDERIELVRDWISDGAPRE